MSQRICAVARRLPASVLARISSHPNTVLRLHDSDEPLSATELATFVQGASSLVCLLSDRIDAAVMDAAGPTLRSIATMSVGYSNIDVPAALARGVRIGNTPGVLTDATADLVLALTLATCRLLPQAALAVRSGEWSSWKPFWSACPLRARANHCRCSLSAPPLSHTAR